MSMLFPVVNYDSISLSAANRCLSDWGHRMGELHRPNGDVWCHGLHHAGELVAVTTTSALVCANVGHMPTRTRANTVELSRVCAKRRDLCRVVLRLWREFVFPSLGYQWAISYQDAVLHSGDLYRFDGWQRFPLKSSSGTDKRSGRKGRTKWIWGWPVEPAWNAQELPEVAHA